MQLNFLNLLFWIAPRGTVVSAGKTLSHWSTANGDDTMVTIWNPADEAQSFIFRLMFPGGGHYDDVMTLGPRATAMFDISDILAAGGPDQEGNIIPAGVQEGSAKIVGLEADNQHVLLTVAAGIYNIHKATCNNNCVTCDGTTTYWVSADPFALAVSSSTQEHLYAQWDTGVQYDYTNSNSTWTSSNTGIATVQTGLVNGVSVGSITLSGGASDEPVYTQVCGLYAPSCPIGGGGGGSSPGASCGLSIVPAVGFTASQSCGGLTEAKQSFDVIFTPSAAACLYDDTSKNNSIQVKEGGGVSVDLTKSSSDFGQGYANAIVYFFTDAGTSGPDIGNIELIFNLQMGSKVMSKSADPKVVCP